MFISVNISGCQFKDDNFINIVNKILEESKLNPQYLQLEITESIMQNIKKLNSVINKLRRLGVKFSIDDFGTGYSSLNILNSLSINTLKIDKSFTARISYDYDTKAIIKSILDIGRNLNLKVIAEGIENEEQLTFLKQNKCSFGQGYYFSRPMNTEEVIRKLKKLNRKYVNIDF